MSASSHPRIRATGDPSCYLPTPPRQLVSRTWTSPTHAVQAVARVSVKSPSSPSAGAVQVIDHVAVAVPR
ncbi:hypothetical protein ACIRD0_34000 [Streptomyces microflavus]|uniref:hypothetical protein n=1 Tax=Streptomyces microflavus TaxID=1919 RepID=UPI00381A39F0